MPTRRALLGRAASLAAVAPAAAQARLRVVASFSILADFVREVAGPDAALSTLVGPDQDAHVFEPSPADARRLAEADAVVLVGLGFEGWIERLMRSAAFKGRRIVAGEGIATLRAGAQRGRVDPHVWQDPVRAQAMVRSIARGLAAADPGSAARFAANAEAYVARLAELDRWIAGEIAAVPKERRRIVTSHDAFAYFEDRYGVDFRAPRGVSTESEPSAADMARLIRDIRREKARVVFLETISAPRLIEQIARESGARLGGRLYSDALSRPDGPAPTYLALMRHNVLRLRDAMLAE